MHSLISGEINLVRYDRINSITGMKDFSLNDISLSDISLNDALHNTYFTER